MLVAADDSGLDGGGERSASTINRGWHMPDSIVQSDARRESSSPRTLIRCTRAPRASGVFHHISYSASDTFFPFFDVVSTGTTGASGLSLMHMAPHVGADHHVPNHAHTGCGPRGVDGVPNKSGRRAHGVKRRNFLPSGPSVVCTRRQSCAQLPSGRRLPQRKTDECSLGCQKLHRSQEATSASSSR